MGYGRTGITTHHTPSPVWLNAHSELLASSFDRLLGYPLIKSGGDIAGTLFHAPFIVVSHDGAADPVLTYGNQAALGLWALDWTQFTQTPSRYTAEADRREERQRLLDRVQVYGFIDDYSGVRISNTGKRFEIRNAIVWNLIDENGLKQGQAATFSDYRFL